MGALRENSKWLKTVKMEDKSWSRFVAPPKYLTPLAVAHFSQGGKNVSPLQLLRIVGGGPIKSATVYIIANIAAN